MISISVYILTSACFRLVVRRSKFILVEGSLQNQDDVIHVKAVRFRSMFDQTLEVYSYDFQMRGLRIGGFRRR
jgi:hypothetical protein